MWMTSPRAGRPEAAALIWDWRAETPAAPKAESAGRARLHGSLQALVAAAIGGAIFVWLSQTVGTVVLTVAAIVGFSALVAPTTLYAAIQRLFMLLGQWTGRALAWVMLVPLFYLFFFPFGLLFRRGRRDRMRRWFDGEDAGSSYWEPHEGITAASAARTRQY